MRRLIILSARQDLIEKVYSDMYLILLSYKSHDYFAYFKFIFILLFHTHTHTYIERFKNLNKIFNVEY